MRIAWIYESGCVSIQWHFGTNENQRMALFESRHCRWWWQSSRHYPSFLLFPDDYDWPTSLNWNMCHKLISTGDFGRQNTPAAVDQHCEILSSQSWGHTGWNSPLSPFSQHCVRFSLWLCQKTIRWSFNSGRLIWGQLDKDCWRQDHNQFGHLCSRN